MSTLLTTPIVTKAAEQATHYELASVLFDLEVRTVTVVIQLKNAAGDVLRTSTLRDSFANIGIPVATGIVVRDAIIAYLKTQGAIN